MALLLLHFLILHFLLPLISILEEMLEFDSYMVLFDLELLMLVPRVFLHVFKLYTCCFNDLWRKFEIIAVFCKFSRTGTDFWATEACASS